MIKKALPILSLSIFTSMLGFAIVAPLLPLYAKSLEASGLSLGLMMGLHPATRLVLMPFIGRFSDRWGRKPFIITGLAITTISAVGYSWAGTMPQLFAVRMLAGAASGMTFPVSQAYLGDICPEGEEGKWTGYFMAAFFAGHGIGPFMGGILTDQFNMNVAFFSMAALNLLALILVIFLLPKVAHRRTATGSMLSSFRAITASPMVRGLMSYRMSYAFARSSLNAFLPIFAANYFGLIPTETGTLLSVHMISISLLQIYLGRIADRFSRRVMLICGLMVNPVIFMALIPSMGNFWMILTLCVLGGFGGAASSPAASALTVEEGRKFGMGPTMATLSTTMSIGFTLGPILGGMLKDTTSISTVFYFGSFVGLMGIILFGWFSRRR
ncbi:MFS transporter [Chloroflexota bacterium]